MLEVAWEEVQLICTSFAALRLTRDDIRYSTCHA